jgi:hypothetical protein
MLQHNNAVIFYTSILMLVLIYSTIRAGITWFRAIKSYLHVIIPKRRPASDGPIIWLQLASITIWLLVARMMFWEEKSKDLGRVDGTWLSVHDRRRVRSRMTCDKEIFFPSLSAYQQAFPGRGIEAGSTSTTRTWENHAMRLVRETMHYQQYPCAQLIRRS